MEKRVLIAVVLSFLVLYVYQSMFMPKPAPKPVARTAQSETAAGAGAAGAGAGAGAAAGSVPQGAAAPANTAPGTTAQAAAPAGTAGAVEVQVGETSARDVVVETPIATTVFSNEGAVLTHLGLKRYVNDAKKPVDLIPHNTEFSARPFSLETGDKAIDARLNTARYRVAYGGPTTDPKTGAITVTFEYRDSGGLGIQKAFTINPRNYTIEARVDGAQGFKTSALAFRMGSGLGDVEKVVASRYTKKAEGILFRDGAVERHDAKAILAQPAYEGNVRWAGVDDHYFMSAALLGGPGAHVTYEARTVTAADGKTTADYISYTVQPPAGTTAVRVFLGPKQFDLLQSIDQDLVRAVDFGWFAFLGVPLLHGLNAINGVIGNYGWSIIILTLLINLAIGPLRHKSVVSMRKMQELQPEIKAIQDRYGKLKATDPDKQKMNTELMELYKSRGVNPAGGCLPMLLTMPVLFAFYNLLSQAIELRGAPFGLWIKDLSLADPLYITPVLMGITMLVQQRMTPSTADPVQQKMFMFMPVVFTVMFVAAPSGLAIYWFVSNLAGIMQQVITNRIIGPPQVRAPRPPAERKMKRVGEGRTNGASA